MKVVEIAGEIVLSTKELISKVEFEPLDDSKEAIVGRQFARTPYLTRWESGWLKFELCTVHILYGSASGEKLERRVEENEQISKQFGKRPKKLSKEYRASILLGDFNIMSPERKTSIRERRLIDAKTYGERHEEPAACPYQFRFGGSGLWRAVWERRGSAAEC